MGEHTSLEDIYFYYVDQYKNGTYSKIEVSGSRVGQGEVFYNLFEIVNEEIDPINAADQFITIQWFQERNDYRYENYTKFYYQPLYTSSLESVEFSELLNFVSPQNLITSQTT